MSWYAQSWTHARTCTHTPYLIVTYMSPQMGLTKLCQKKRYAGKLHILYFKQSCPDSQLS